MTLTHTNYLYGEGYNTVAVMRIKYANRYLRNCMIGKITLKSKP